MCDDTWKLKLRILRQRVIDRTAVSDPRPGFDWDSPADSYEGALWWVQEEIDDMLGETPEEMTR